MSSMVYEKEENKTCKLEFLNDFDRNLLRGTRTSERKDLKVQEDLKQ